MSGNAHTRRLERRRRERVRQLLESVRIGYTFTIDIGDTLAQLARIATVCFEAMRAIVAAFAGRPVYTPYARQLPQRCPA